GESAYTEIRNEGHSADNVVNGVMKVAVPATFGVLTTIAAFLPILMVSGVSGQFFAPIGWVVVLALLMSLVESKLILPAHLAHMKVRRYENETPGRLVRFQRSFSDTLFRFVDAFYIPSMRAMLQRRYLAVSVFIGMLILSIGLILSPFVRVVVFPAVTGDFMQVNMRMNEGTPIELTHQTMEQLASSLERAEARMMDELELDDPVVRTVFAWAGETTGNVVVEMHKTDDPRISTTVLERIWRDEVPPLVGVRSLQIGGPGGPGGDGPDVSFQLVGQDLQQLESAASQLEQAVRNFEGTFDVRNSFDGGVRELQLSIRDEAEVLGLSQQDLARQVRSAFFGEEVQRIQRGQDDVRVMVRYPKDQRTSQGYLENMRIRTAAGEEVPFSAVADIEVGSSPSRIRRYNRERSVSVTARVDKDIAEPGRIVGQLRTVVLPEILSAHPGVNFRISGSSRDQQQLMRELAANTVFAIFLIYALIAIPLRSYIQPILIMSVIPFGMIGAVVGHLFLGIPISLLSMFGIIALSGVVINDSLILVDFVNKHRQQGESREDAIIKATRARFRPIVLTSATTFLGLAPITLFEDSLQAQLVVPMAVSLSFGILFATAITLALIPLLYLIADDFLKFIRRYLAEFRAFIRTLLTARKSSRNARS
ncbi:MAG: efflux RND transporter permease subunit, partial [Pseudomonadota bacterium]